MTDFLPYPGDVLAGAAADGSAAQRQLWGALLQQGAQLAWNQARPRLTEGLTAQLGQARGLPQGWTLYDVEVRLATEVTLARAVAGSTATGGVPMQLRLGPDLVLARSTTPSVLDRALDPRFSVDFGIVIDFSIGAVPERMLLRATVDSARITGTDFSGAPHVDSQNVAADLAMALAAMVAVVGGPDVVAMAEHALEQQDFAATLDQALQPVNDMLGVLAAEGMGAVVAMFADADLPAGVSTQALGLTGGAPPAAAPLLVLATPVVGTGTIRGQVHWPRELGEPASAPPYAGAFRLKATIDRGAAQGAFAQATDVTHLASWDYAGTDDEHAVAYALSGLPTDEPISVECSAAGDVPWTGPAAGRLHGVERDGWAGRVTISPAVSVTTPIPDAEKAFRGIAEQVELNPQPIPPGRSALGPASDRRAGPGAEVELNPQPIPPGRETTLERAVHGKDRGRASHVVARSRTSISGTRTGELDATDVGRTPIVLPRNDPTGSGTVASIDFLVTAVNQPG